MTPGATAIAVQTEALSKSFGTIAALASVNLRVPVGAVYLLAGNNGAGKSTLFRVLLDLVRPDRGSARVLQLAPQIDGARLRANIGYVPESPDWGYGWMNAGRLLAHHASYFRSWDARYAARLVATFDVPSNRPLVSMSKGQARRLHLVLALAHRPPLLILDEPLDGFDPHARDAALGVLAEHLDESPATVVMSTHHVGEFEGLADHVGFLQDGKLRLQITRDALHDQLRQADVETSPGWQAPRLLGFRMLAASFWPAAPPAPIMV